MTRPVSAPAAARVLAAALRANEPRPSDVAAAKAMVAENNANEYRSRGEMGAGFALYFEERARGWQQVAVEERKREEAARGR